MSLQPSKQRVADVNLALQMLQRGAPFDHVRRVTNLTLAFAVKLGWFTEVKVPDPKGYKYDEKGEIIGHDGKTLSTGQFRPQWPTATVPMMKVGGELVRMHPSNKQLKKTDRRGFFNSRRARKLKQEVTHDAGVHQEASQPRQSSPGEAGPLPPDGNAPA